MVGQEQPAAKMQVFEDVKRMYRCEARCNVQESISVTEPAGIRARSGCLTKIETDREQRGVKKRKGDGQMSLTIRFLLTGCLWLSGSWLLEI